jgi:hypothetical protein
LCDAHGEPPIGEIVPFVLATKEPGNFSHEVDFAFGSKALLEQFFRLIREREMLEIVHVQADVNGR